ncbi:MAG TPA: site-2 protease family protein [Candidatus Anaerofilum excrementigallinarum]|nr:site-2 protease family protein [Candidatus Anaerofilum excrementigallinarum]
MLFVYLVRAVAMLLIIPVHEAAHAFVSYKLGDPTAKNYGRLTLNPLAHFDPFGALAMILAGIGWAKPVPTDVRRFRHPKRDMAISAAAGPVSNLLMAYLGMILYKLAYYRMPVNSGQLVMLFLSIFISLNISLAVFNLLPIPPFDGSRIFLAFLPTRLYFKAMQYERYIMMAVLLLVLIGALDTPLYYLNQGAQRVLWAATGYIEPLLGIGSGATAAAV